MEEKSLKIVGADKNFFGRLTNTLTKIIMPTKIGLNSIIISIKRNAMLKAYFNLIESEESSEKTEAISKRYDAAYASYLEAIDKYIMDSIYKKVKNKTATKYEEDALSKYYNVTSLKDTQYAEYKYRKQKYLIELDYSGLEASKKDKVFSKYKIFYYKTVEGLYKGILKNYSVQIANAVNSTPSAKEAIYKKIFDTIENYLETVLPVKIECEPKIDADIVEQYDKFTAFLAGKLDKKDIIEKQMIVLGISRKIFTHSLPLVVAEQCYIKLIANVRDLIITSPNKKKEDMAYEMLIQLIEEFNIKLLSTKIYWEKAEERQKFKEFWDKYKGLEQNEQYEIEKQVLFIKEELKELYTAQDKNEKIIAFYKNKLVEFGKMKRMKNSCITKKERLMKPKAYAKFLEKKAAEDAKPKKKPEIIEETIEQEVKQKKRATRTKKAVQGV